jgi:hypothetical protein
MLDLVFVFIPNRYLNKAAMSRNRGDLRGKNDDGDEPVDGSPQRQ